MIDNDELLGFALNALEVAEADSVRARLADDTAAQMNLAKLHKLLAPLAADREHPAPPLDLVSATLSRLDAQSAQPRWRGGSAHRFVELALAASIGLLGFGLVATGVSRFQAENLRTACNNNLRTMGVAFNRYADTNGGRFPQVGTSSAPTAGDFPKLLGDGGQWSKACDGVQPVGYAYSLGHRNGQGQLVGSQRTADLDAFLPLAADMPTRHVNADGPVSPHGRGANVLYQDGHTMYTRSPSIGLNGDHIYYNDAGLPKAGLHPGDTVLGRPGDVP